MSKKILYCCLLLLVSFSIAFAPYQSPDPAKPVFQDDFNYLTNGLLTGSFAAWKDGAQITVSLAKDYRPKGGGAMRIDLVGPNPRTASRDASVYRILQLLERNWSGGKAARFWLENPSEFPLVLSFNFKEAFNEYWATTGSQVFFLQDEAGALTTQNAAYGNLPIPAGYTGYVIVPFAGLRVPDWNTARGDLKMQLGEVESFAFGVSVDQHYPRTFYIDDFSVISDEYPYLEIHGGSDIEIPAEGELRVPFSAGLLSPDGQAFRAVQPDWSLAPGADPRLKIDADGRLNVPAGLAPQTVTLVAAFVDGGVTRKAEWPVTLRLNPAQASASPQPTVPPVVSDPALKEKSAYEKFSQDFERWSYQNRPLFVGLTVGLVLIVLVVLSFFQRRMR